MSESDFAKVETLCKFFDDEKLDSLLVLRAALLKFAKAEIIDADNVVLRLLKINDGEDASIVVRAAVY